MIGIDMSGKYYEVNFDSQMKEQWFLDEPLTASGEVIDGWEFTGGRPYTGPSPTNILIFQPGRHTQFHLGALDMPVVTDGVAQVITELAPKETECFPVLIDSRIRGYQILNVIATEDCLDESRTDFEKWTPEDGRPEKIGAYRTVINLTIDPLRTHGRHIFRVKGWKIALIVSEKVREALQRFEDLGVVFTPVT